MGDKSFCEYLSEANIICGAKAGNELEIISQLASLLKKEEPELDEKKVIDEAIAREKLQSTAIIPGVALPHARIAGLKKPLTAMACSPEGIDFNGVRVRIIIMLVTPLEEPNLHMQILSALARAFKSQDIAAKVAASALPREALSQFSTAHATMPAYLLARDLMKTDFIKLQETDSFADAIEVFSTSQEEVLPVLDRTGDFRGVVALTDLLGYCLPEHLLWLEDLSPMYQFQPFTDTLKTACETKVADLLSDDFIQVGEKVPAIQLAKLFLVNKVHALMITNDAGKLVGTVSLKDFSSKIFWK